MARTSQDASPLIEASHGDEEVRARVKEVAMQVLDMVQDYIQSPAYPPNTKLSVARSLLPTLVKALNTSDENEEVAEMKRQIKEMMEEMRESRQPAPVVNQVDVPEDLARPPT